MIVVPNGKVDGLWTSNVESMLIGNVSESHSILTATKSSTKTGHRRTAIIVCWSVTRISGFFVCVRAFMALIEIAGYRHN